MTIALPLALGLALLGEGLGLRHWLYFSLAGIAVAIAGFAFHYGDIEWTLRAFSSIPGTGVQVLTGLSAGLMYWLAAGRKAGWNSAADEAAFAASADKLVAHSAGYQAPKCWP